MTQLSPILCLLLCLAALPAPAAAPAVYDQALSEVQNALVSQAQALRAGVVPTREAPSLVAKRVLEPIRSVETPSGLPQPVDAGRLIDAVQTAEATHSSEDKAGAFEALNQQITTLRQALVRSGRPRLDTAETVHSAQAVLAGEEFASDPPPPPSMAERAAEWLDRWLARLFSRPSPNYPAMPPVNPNVIQGIFILIIAAAFAVLVYVLAKALSQRGAKAKPLGLAEEEAVLVEARDNDSLLALAEQQAKAGDYRRAFRLVYLAALVALDTGGVLRFDRSKTNWEYLRALRAAGRGDLYQALTPVTREFDQVWYGFSRTDSAQYAHALDQYHALLAASPLDQSAAPNRVRA